MRQRRGLNITIYVLDQSQKFVEARSIPRGKLGHADRSASIAIRSALGVYQWIVLEGAKTFKRWSNNDWIILLRCLPNEPLFSGDKIDHAKLILAIPSIVEQETKKLDLQRVMNLDAKTIPSLLRRLRALTPMQLIAVNDQVEVLRVEYMKNS